MVNLKSNILASILNINRQNTSVKRQRHSDTIINQSQILWSFKGIN